MTEKPVEAPGASPTGRVGIGAYILDVGDPSGCVLKLASKSSDTRELRRALAGRRTRRLAASIKATEGRLEDAGEIAGKLERATALFEELAGGRLDAASVSDEVDALVALLKRLDREGRWQDALRVARCLSMLLALLGRWAELLDSLRMGLRAAEQLGDRLGEAWAHHELGTLHLAAGRHAEADRQLEDAHRIRQQAGDRPGLAVTERNLAVLCQRLRRLLHRRGMKPTRPALTLLGIAIVLVVGAGGAVLAASGGPHPTPLQRAEQIGFSFVPSAPHTTQSIVFTATATDRRDPVASYTWRWGDGDPAGNRIQRHSYRAARTYTVTLIVRDARGRTIGRIARTVVVQPPAIETGPNAVFSSHPHSPLVGRPVAFDARSSYDPAARIVGYGWTFGDGQSAQGAGVSHNFARSGPYRVSLTVTDAAAHRNTITQTVVIAARAGERRTEISLACPHEPVSAGGLLVAAGTVGPRRGKVPVAVIFRSSQGKEVPVEVTSGSEGRYRASVTAVGSGPWSMQSILPESSGYRPSSSETCTIAADGPRTATSISLRCPSNEEPAGLIALSGAVTPARAKANVTVVIHSSSGKETRLALTTADDGSYQTTANIDEPGRWTVGSKLAGGGDYEASESASCEFSIPRGQSRTPTSISLQCPPSEVLPGEVPIAGSITPVQRAARVSVTYTSPSRTETITVYSKGAGYQTSLVAEQHGVWIVKSTLLESGEYATSTSAACRFSVVTPPPG